MTKQEFDEAVDRPPHGMTDAEERVFMAANFVMRHRRGMPDDQEWAGPTDAELAALLFSADRRQRKLLKKIAEGLVAEKVTQH
jgi:hypothetical protein